MKCLAFQLAASLIYQPRRVSTIGECLISFNISSSWLISAIAPWGLSRLQRQHDVAHGEKEKKEYHTGGVGPLDDPAVRKN
jgi:hypothetical protein